MSGLPEHAHRAALNSQPLQRVPLGNHLRYAHCHDGDETRFSVPFGDLYSVTAICLTGDGHNPHLEIRSTYGLRLDVTAEWLTALVRQAPAALAKLPFIPDVHDAVGEE